MLLAATGRWVKHYSNEIHMEMVRVAVKNMSDSFSVRIERQVRMQMRTQIPARNLLFSLYLVMSLLLMALMAAGCSSGSLKVQETASPSPTVAHTSPGASSDGESSIPDLYDQVNPSVVRITTLTVLRGRFRSQQSQGLGSGVIIDRDGDILTNYHVVAGAQTLEVTLFDEASAEAQVVGTDPGDDLAIVKADFSGIDLSVANLGDSSQVRVGESVIAIGNPFGLAGTVTEGIISGVGRTSPDQQNGLMRELIQTDTAINPGNSGGPLLNLSGEVIGINSSIENPNGGGTFVGVGYAVPIETAKEFLPQMLEGKTVIHARLGVSGQTLTSSLAKNLGISQVSGVYVLQVDRGGSAATAGVVGAAASADNSLAIPPGGDVITGIDDEQINTTDQMDDYIDTKQPGDVVTLRIVRGGNNVDTAVTLAEWPNP
jgi:S1-C subfamily serine protease